jgi:hypothetical protein
MTKVFKSFDQLREVGFQQDEHDQWLAANCRVNVFRMDDSFQVFVTLRTGAEIAFTARTADTIVETAAERSARPKAGDRGANKPQSLL